MAVETRRHCGFRSVGGLYLIGEGIGVYCHLLPYELHVCPTCGCGIKFSRGLTWITPSSFLDKCREGEDDGLVPVCHKVECFMCKPPDGQHGLLWVGEKFYTPESFAKEAAELGVSKRIGSIPRNIKIGETIIYVAHKKGKRVLIPCDKTDKGDKTLDGYTTKYAPAIFYAFKPREIQMIITEKMAENEEEVEKLKKRGITPVVVPTNDSDHNPKGLKDWPDLKKK